jgi:hypothetical protein
MIDIENALFDDIYKTVKAEYDKADITDEYDPSDAKFPKITVSIRNEGEPYGMIDSSGIMKGANVFVEVNVYASRQTGYKATAKEIVARICDRMKVIGFTLSMCEPIPNQQSDQIYRYVARFNGMADKNNTIFRR